MILANEKLVRTMSSAAMTAYKPTSRDLSARCPIGLLPNRRLLAANIFNLFLKRGFSEKCYSFPVGFLFHQEGSLLPPKIF